MSGRPGVGERHSDQNLSPVSPLDDAEYDAHLRLSAGQRVQLVQQNLSDGLVDPLRGESGMQLGVAVSGERTPCVDPPVGQPGLSAPVDCEVRRGLLSHSSGVSTGISSALQNAADQSVPALNSTARYSTVQYSKVPEGVPEGVTDSTPESSDSDCDSERSVSGGGGRIDVGRAVPLTSGVPVESGPTCKASLVPAVGINGIAGQSVASSHGSRDALGQEVAAEPVAGSSGGQWITKPRPRACYVEQEVTTAERGQSAATKLVQRVVAGVPRACPELGATVVKEPAAHVEPGDERQTSGGIIPTDLTPS